MHFSFQLFYQLFFGFLKVHRLFGSEDVLGNQQRNACFVHAHTEDYAKHDALSEPMRIGSGTHTRTYLRISQSVFWRLHFAMVVMSNLTKSCICTIHNIKILKYCVGKWHVDSVVAFIFSHLKKLQKLGPIKLFGGKLHEFVVHQVYWNDELKQMK